MTLRGGTKINILSTTEYVKHIGNHLNLVNPTHKDIDGRLYKGWGKSKQFRPQLCATGILQKKRSASNMF